MISYFHQNMVVHCDLKPQNVMRFGRKWKLIDFNNARKIGDTLPESVTPCYASPEWVKFCYKSTGAKGEEDVKVNEAIDVWGLGLILFEVFRGYPLFETMPDGPLILALNGAKDFIPMGVVDDVQAQHLLTDCLALDPAERAKTSDVLVS